MKQKHFFIFETEPGDDFEDGPYPLARTTTRRRRKLARLQLETSYLSEQERYQLCEEMLWQEEYIEKVEEREGGLAITWKDDLQRNKIDFLAAFAEMAFPDAPVAGNEEKLDLEEVQKAYADFLSAGERMSSVLSPLLSAQAASPTRKDSATKQKRATTTSP